MSKFNVEFLSQDMFVIEPNDEVIVQECEDCGHTFTPDWSEGESFCPECESPDLLTETTYESVECIVCGKPTMSNESGYRLIFGDDITEEFCCENCFRKIQKNILDEARAREDFIDYEKGEREWKKN